MRLYNDSRKRFVTLIAKTKKKKETKKKPTAFSGAQTRASHNRSDYQSGNETTLNIKRQL
jgi:putative IMPACT (imprinted ancient) family translation regulator